jgi:hypothetical protein
MATDASGMMIHLDRTHAPDLNLAVLRRLDASIESIIASASHVAVYVYSSEKKEWVRATWDGPEGSRWRPAGEWARARELRARLAQRVTGSWTG